MNPKYSRYYTFIKPILRNKYVKTYSPLAFSLVTTIIFAIFAIKPTLSTIVSLQKSIKEQQGLLKQIDEKSLNLSLAKRNLEDIDPQTADKLKKLMPTQTSITELVDIVTGLASQQQASISGLQFQAVDLQGPTDNPLVNINLQTIEFNFNLQGSYQNLGNFISQVSKQRRLIDIQAMNFSKQTEGPLVVTVSAKAYFYKR